MTVRIEYRVRAVKRYIVTRFEDTTESATSTQFGEFPNIAQAEAVAQALHKSDVGSSFATIEDKREPVGVFYTYTSEQAERLMAFVASLDQ